IGGASISRTPREGSSTKRYGSSPSPSSQTVISSAPKSRNALATICNLSGTSFRLGMFSGIRNAIPSPELLSTHRRQPESVIVATTEIGLHALHQAFIDQLRENIENTVQPERRQKREGWMLGELLPQGESVATVLHARTCPVRVGVAAFLCVTDKRQVRLIRWESLSEVFEHEVYVRAWTGQIRSTGIAAIRARRGGLNAEVGE